jgi:hypothetical protein
MHKDSEHSLGILNQTKVPLMGIDTNLKKCFVQISENETRMKIFLNVVFTGKGKISVPKGIHKLKSIGRKIYYRRHKEVLFKS